MEKMLKGPAYIVTPLNYLARIFFVMFNASLVPGIDFVKFDSCIICTVSSIFGMVSVLESYLTSRRKGLRK